MSPSQRVPGSESADLDAVERVEELLKRVTQALGLDAIVTVEERDGIINGTVEQGDVGIFIGRHGQTIDAIQHLAFKVASQVKFPTQVAIDAGGYRAHREQLLHRQADQAADSALETGEAIALDAMSPIERKVVHEYLKRRSGVATYSEGVDPDRHLVVEPVQR